MLSRSCSKIMLLVLSALLLGVPSALVAQLTQPLREATFAGNAVGLSLPKWRTDTLSHTMHLQPANFLYRRCNGNARPKADACHS